MVDFPYNAVNLQIKVTPNASKNEILGMTNGVWKVKIAAPPDKGRANKELIAFFSKRLGVKKSSISILRGQTSHNKVVSIEGISPEEIVSQFST